MTFEEIQKEFNITPEMWKEIFGVKSWQKTVSTSMTGYNARKTKEKVVEQLYELFASNAYQKGCNDQKSHIESRLPAKIIKVYLTSEENEKLRDLES